MEKEALKEATKAQLKRYQEMKNEQPKPKELPQIFEDLIGPDNFVAH